MSLTNNEVLTFCADDAHGAPIMMKADELGIKPSEFIDEVKDEHQKSLARFGIEYTNYHSTHSKENESLVSEIYLDAISSGYIYKKEIEQCFDENGINWPTSVAPYQVCVTALDVDEDSEVMKLASRIYDELGAIRYNTTLKNFEACVKINATTPPTPAAWRLLGGVIDIDQDTYIIAETNPLDDNDEIQIYTAGVERLKIDASGSTDIYGNLGVKEGFSKADEVLSTASKGIAEVITHHYTQNIDLKDAKTVLSNSGTAIMGAASSSGTNRANDAITKALDSPLLNDNRITGAKNVLLLIVSGNEEITIDEIGEINDYIQEQAGYGANIIMLSLIHI